MVETGPLVSHQIQTCNLIEVCSFGNNIAKLIFQACEKLRAETPGPVIFKDCHIKDAIFHQILENMAAVGEFGAVADPGL